MTCKTATKLGDRSIGMHQGILLKVTKLRINRRQQREEVGKYSEEILSGNE